MDAREFLVGSHGRDGRHREDDPDGRWTTDAGRLDPRALPAVGDAALMNTIFNGLGGSL